jgi:hypothetical protein
MCGSAILTPDEGTTYPSALILGSLDETIYWLYSADYSRSEVAN